MKTLARGLVLAWSVVWPLGAPAHAALVADPAVDALAAAPELGSYEVGPIGVPRSTGKISLTVTVIENGKPKTSPVTIASGVIQPYTSPTFDPLDDTDVRADKIAEQRGKFSQMKAQAIDDPIPDGTRVIWGNTDPGLDFTFAVDGLAPPISTPGPPAIALLAAGLLPVATWAGVSCRSNGQRGPACPAGP